MEKQEFIEFREIRDYIDLDSTSFTVYLKELFNDLTEHDENSKEKGIPRNTFLNYFKLPSLISNKLYRVFDKKNTGYISSKSFISIMIKLFLGNFEETTELIFSIYDFDNDGIIKKEDVRLILSFLPITKSKESNCTYKDQLENLDEIDKILSDSFVTSNNNLNFDEFINVIENIKSDIYIQLLCFLYYKKPFEEGTIYQLRKLKNFDFSESNFNLMRSKNDKKESNLKKIACSKKKPKFLSTVQIMKVNIQNENNLDFSSLQDFGFKTTAQNNVYTPKSVENRENDDKKKSNNKSEMDIKTETEQECKRNQVYKLELKPKVNNRRKSIIYKEAQFNLRSEIKNTISNIMDKSTSDSNSLNQDSDNNLLSEKVSSKKGNITFILEDKNPINFSNITNKSSQKSTDETLDSNKKIFYEDWLYTKDKEGKLRKSYASLFGSELSFFKTEKKSELVTIKHISSFFIIDGNSETKLIDKEKYYYFILHQTKEKSKYYFCDNLKNKNLWLQNIRNALGRVDITEYYEFTGDLGHGSFGIVKKAINKVTQQTVAIKIINKNKLLAGEIDLIRNEVELLKHFQHPNIVRLYDSFETYEDIYIVMEYLSGGDLIGLLESKVDISEKFIAKITHSIASVVEYLNFYGVIHRDLKPENIMFLNKIDKHPIIKVIDLGLTRILAQGENLCEGFGTITYVAPEVLLKKSYNKQIDVWSIGVIMYFLLSNGKLPFIDKDDELIAKKIILLDPSYADELFPKRSKSSILLINECLNKDQEKRITIKKFLNHRWFSELLK